MECNSEELWITKDGHARKSSLNRMRNDQSIYGINLYKSEDSFGRFVMGQSAQIVHRANGL